MTSSAANLREAVVMRDDEETEEDFTLRWSHGLARLDLAAEFAETSGPDLLARLRTPQDTALGEPCTPFCPPVLLEAADAIEALEAGAGDPSPEKSADLVTRLLGFYPVGPDNTPEFGYQIYWSDALRIEAAGRICALLPEVGTNLGVITSPVSAPRTP